jgi:autotransporter-associated beta strand protein
VSGGSLGVGTLTLTGNGNGILRSYNTSGQQISITLGNAFVLGTTYGTQLTLGGAEIEFTSTAPVVLPSSYTIVGVWGTTNSLIFDGALTNTGTAAASLTVLNGAWSTTVTLNANNTATGTLSIGDAGHSGTVVLNGVNQWTEVDVNSNWDRQLFLNETGGVAILAANSLHLKGGLVTGTASGGTIYDNIQLDASSWIGINDVHLAGDLYVNATGLSIGNWNGTTYLDGKIRDSGNGLQVSSRGTMFITADNTTSFLGVVYPTFTGTLTVHDNWVQVTNPNGLGGANAGSAMVTNNAWLFATNTMVYVNNLNGDSGVISNAGTANGGFIVTGSGTVASQIRDWGNGGRFNLTVGTGSSNGVLTLTNGGNTYTGGTVLNSGTLVASGTNDVWTLGTSTVTLNGGTLASGPGVNVQIGNGGNTPVVAGSGAHTIAPGGIGAVGTLTLGSTLSLNSHSTLAFDVSDSGGSDLLNVLGVLSVTGGLPATVSVNPFLGSLTPGNSYTLASFLGTSTVTAANFALLGSGSLVVIAGGGGTELLELVAGSGSAAVFNGTGTLVATGSAVADWSAAGNWTDSASVHGTPGTGSSTTDAAVLTDSVAGVATTVDLHDANVSLAGLTLSHAAGFTIQSSGAGSLTFNNGSGTATVTATAGQHVISAPVVLASQTALNVSSGASVTLSGTISSAMATPAIHLNGSGTVTVASSASFNFTNVGTINVNSGVLNLNTAAGTGSLNVNVGTAGSAASAFFGLATGTNITLNSLTVGANGLAVLGSGQGALGMHSVLTVNSLSIASGGVLDLNDNALVVSYTNPTSSPLGTIQSLINDHQIVSSVVNNYNSNTDNPVTLTVACLEASNLYGTGKIWPWAGAPALVANPLSGAPTQILIMPTILGDTDLNGQVDFNDLLAVLNSYPMASGATLDMGDTDGNGTVDFNDLLAVLNGYGFTMASLDLASSSDSMSMSSPSSVQVTVVPEPTTMALLALGGVIGLAGGAIRRRRHGSKAAA